MVARVEEQVENLMFGSEFGDPELQEAMRSELTQRLTEAREQGTSLRVYAGYDPTRPDIHLGHSITMRKLRQFQDYGHHVIFLVGTFTAQVGDTSDKDTGRPTIAEERVMAAAQTYAAQCYKILDSTRTEVAYNSDWLAKMSVADFVGLARRFTVQQFLTRDVYKKRIEEGNPLGLHEFFYALLQGYDAVHLKCDVQIGATEQLFNIMAGRKLQQALGQKPSVCITFPILVGTDGKARMSKSTGNYIGITEVPDEQYGKVMSVSDQTMLEWMRLITRWSPAEIEERIRGAESGEIHPMELKKELAWEIVDMYHGREAANAARDHFQTVHQEASVPEEIPESVLDDPMGLIDLLVRERLAASRNEARRLIRGNGVRFDGEVVSDFRFVVSRSGVLQVGKRHFRKVVVAAG